MLKGCKAVRGVRKIFRTEKQPSKVLRRMLSNKTHRVYAKFHARKTHGVLAFRAKKVKKNQVFSAPYQTGVGIDVLPLILSQKATVNATISEPCTMRYRGLFSPLIF